MRLPLALWLLGSFALPRTHALKALDLMPLDVEQGDGIWLSWWLAEKRTQWLDISPLNLTGAKEKTAIVTHAGKNDQEFIDMAVMLAVSLRRHVPDYPRIALGVEGMSLEHQNVLKRAGWQLLLVEDWIAPSTSRKDCGGLCADDKFFWRWQDAVEKLNMFRLPVKQVLFLDADTYVMSDKLDSLLKMQMPDGNISMARDGCHEDFNSGVMLFKPDLAKFKAMVTTVAGVMVGNLTKRHDQPIINAVYKGNVTVLDKKYNCMNPTGRTSAAPCAQGCTETVVAHFTGLPKPATADPDMLDIVRKPHSAVMHCFKTNHGSCGVWSQFYCDLEGNKGFVTRKLRKKIVVTGRCCHTPRRPKDPPECHDECSVQVRVKSDMHSADVRGVYNLSNIVPDKLYHAGRPIFVGPRNAYLFYVKSRLNWAIGPNYTSDVAYTYSHKRVSCPTLAMQWKGLNRKMEWELVTTTVTAVEDGLVAEDMAFDVATRLWVRNKAPAPAASLPESKKPQSTTVLASNVSKESAPHVDDPAAALLMARRSWAD